MKIKSLKFAKEKVLYKNKFFFFSLAKFDGNYFTNQ